VVGNRLGWRMTFVGVAVMSAAAVVGLLAGLPARAGAGMVTATLRERVRVVRQPRVAPSLLVTTVWAVGTYAVYSFIASFLAAAVGGFTLLHATVTDLGWVGAACELAALTLFLKTRAAARAQGTPADERTSPCAST